MIEDPTGMRFGCKTVIKELSRGKERWVLEQCDCGAQRRVRLFELTKAGYCPSHCNKCKPKPVSTLQRLYV